MPSAKLRRAYFASALTSLPSGTPRRRARDSVAEAVGTVFLEHGGASFYDPAKNAPDQDPDTWPAQTYEKDRTAIMNANILFLYANDESFGAGQEVEIAAAEGIPVVALKQVDREGVPGLSRMVRGSPTFRRLITYHSVDDLKKQLRICLEHLEQEPAVPPAEPGLDLKMLAWRVSDAQQRIGLGDADTARALGISIDAFWGIKGASAAKVALGPTLLNRLLAFFRIPLSDLEGDVPTEFLPTLGRNQAYTDIGALVEGFRHGEGLSDRDKETIRRIAVELDAEHDE